MPAVGILACGLYLRFVELCVAVQLLVAELCQNLVFRVDIILTERVFRCVLYVHLFAGVHYILRDHVNPAELADIHSNGSIAVYGNVAGIYQRIVV